MRKIAGLMISVVLVLSTIGIVMLASTSEYEAAAHYHDRYYFLKRQALYLAIGMGAMFAGYFVNYRLYRRYFWLIGAITIGMLAMVIIPHVGLNINGSRRWLRAGPFTIQPSEIAKFAVIVVLSWWMSKHDDRIREFGMGIMAPGALLLPFIGLIVKEPDFGTTIVCASVGLALMFVGGSRLRYLSVISVIGVVILALIIMHNPNRVIRFLAFLDPWRYEKTEAYQLLNGEYAFVVGGFSGVGFGHSLQKQFYLPESYADFIFPIIGEELGVLLSMAIVLLFVGYFLCGLKISASAPDTFGRLVAFGITMLITMQAAFNIAVVTGCIPTKGLPLPFISYGGTSLIVSLGMVGVLANVARETDVEKLQRLGAIKDRARRI